MNKVVISEFMDKQALKGFPADFDVLYDPELVDQRNTLLGMLNEVDALIVRNRTQVDQALLSAAPKIKVIGRLGVGLDNIDLEACKKRKIAVLPATGANSNSVAEYVLGVIMSLSRKAYQHPETLNRMKSGQWPRNDLIGGEIAGKILGLIGLGDIARQVAQKARTLGMTVLAHDPYLPQSNDAWSLAEYCELDKLLSLSDCVSLHIPLTKTTKGLINTNAIKMLKTGAIIINTSRGGIIDEQALASALRTGKLAGAALDVFETEPMTAKSGALFKDLDNVILTPHIAGITQEGNKRVSAVTVSNVLAALKHSK